MGHCQSSDYKLKSKTSQDSFIVNIEKSPDYFQKTKIVLDTLIKKLTLRITELEKDSETKVLKAEKEILTTNEKSIISQLILDLLFINKKLILRRLLKADIEIIKTNLESLMNDQNIPTECLTSICNVMFIAKQFKTEEDLNELSVQISKKFPNMHFTEVSNQIKDYNETNKFSESDFQDLFTKIKDGISSYLRNTNKNDAYVITQEKKFAITTNNNDTALNTKENIKVGEIKEESNRLAEKKDENDDISLSLKPTNETKSPENPNIIFEVPNLNITIPNDDILFSSKQPVNGNEARIFDARSQSIVDLDINKNITINNTNDNIKMSTSEIDPKPILFPNKTTHYDNPNLLNPTSNDIINVTFNNDGLIPIENLKITDSFPAVSFNNNPYKEPTKDVILGSKVSVDVPVIQMVSHKENNQKLSESIELEVANYDYIDGYSNDNQGKQGIQFKNNLTDVIRVNNNSPFYANNTNINLNYDRYHKSDYIKNNVGGINNKGETFQTMFIPELKTLGYDTLMNHLKDQTFNNNTTYSYNYTQSDNTNQNREFNFKINNNSNEQINKINISNNSKMNNNSSDNNNTYNNTININNNINNHNPNKQISKSETIVSNNSHNLNNNLSSNINNTNTISQPPQTFTNFNVNKSIDENINSNVKNNPVINNESINNNQNINNPSFNIVEVNSIISNSFTVQKNNANDNTNANAYISGISDNDKDSNVVNSELVIPSNKNEIPGSFCTNSANAELEEDNLV